MSLIHFIYINTVLFVSNIIFVFIKNNYPSLWDNMRILLSIKESGHYAIFEHQIPDQPIHLRTVFNLREINTFTGHTVFDLIIALTYSFFFLFFFFFFNTGKTCGKMCTYLY